MKRILHISDLHGNLKPLHKAANSGAAYDWIILTGDLAPTHVKYMTLRADGFREIDRIAEAAHQLEWATNALKPLLDKIPHSKIIIINGNHDFCDYSTIADITLFKGATTIIVDGVKMGLAVGIKPMVYEWHEELGDGEFENLLKSLDQDIQVLITHAPPSNILDTTGHGHRIGYDSLYRYIFGLAGMEPHFTKMTLHLFGHCHEANGMKELEFDEGRSIVFSNAACGANVIEGEF